MVNPNTPGYFARFLHQMVARGVLSGAPQYAFSIDRNAGLGKYPGWKCHLTLSVSDGTKIACSFSSNSKKNAKQGAAHEGFVMLIHHLHESGRLSFTPASRPVSFGPATTTSFAPSSARAPPAGKFELEVDEKSESVVTTSPDPEKESVVATSSDGGDELIADIAAVGESVTITVPAAALTALSNPSCVPVAGASGASDVTDAGAPVVPAAPTFVAAVGDAIAVE